MANERRRAGRRMNANTIPSGCEKITFVTKADARRYLKLRRGTPTFSAKHAYSCPTCGGWHITSQSQAHRSVGAEQLAASGGALGPAVSAGTRGEG